MTPRRCDECGSALPAAAKRFCSPSCRNRYNNRRATERPVAESEHGTRTGYARGCRCGHCRDFNADYSRRYREAHPTPPAPPRSRAGIKIGRRNPDEHGTSSAYHYGCRCAACKKAVTAENKQWRLANPERFTANQTRYRRRNPDKVRGTSAARAEAKYDEQAIAYVDILLRDPCTYCGGPSDTIDHIEPVSRSRSSEWLNLTPACRSCNSAKGTKSLLTFLLYKVA